MPDKLAIIAGGGPVPRHLADAAEASGRSVVILALEGYTDTATVANRVHRWVPLGPVGVVLDWLKQQQVTELVLVGRLRRPAWSELKLDWQAVRALTRIGAYALGDDGLLRGIARFFEEQGFRVLAVQDILQDVLAPAGVLGRIAPDQDRKRDIARGLDVAAHLGRADVGQAVVVQQGLVLAVEALEGTDALIDRSAALHREGPGGVLVKLRKPTQDHRLDLPTIGVTTVERAAAAGLSGIAVEAGGTLLMERAAAIAAADAAGLFLIGLEVPR